MGYFPQTDEKALLKTTLTQVFLCILFGTESRRVTRAGIEFFWKFILFIMIMCMWVCVYVYTPVQ